MASSYSRRLEAVQAANELLVERHVDQESRIDVFSLCESVGLWLVFKPMPNLLGAFIPSGRGGVLITTQRPLSVQRYTVAHELGHWALEHDREIALDDEICVFGFHKSEREQLAQLFAAHLLMPPPLAYALAARLGISNNEVSPEQAYSFARECGVSYEAAVRHLRTLDFISQSQLEHLLSAKPIDIKTRLGLGHRPKDGRAEVWVVDERWDDARVSISQGDEIVVSLPENRSSGFVWRSEGQVPSLARNLQESWAEFRVDDSPGFRLEVVRDDYIPRGPRVRRGSDRLLNEPTPDVLVGAGGRRILTLRAEGDGDGRVGFRYTSPWDADPTTSGTLFRLQVTVNRMRTDASLTQLAAARIGPDE